MTADGEASEDEKEEEEPDVDISEQNGQGDAEETQGEVRAPRAVTRGSMLKLSGGSGDQYRLEIGICGATRSDGEEVLEVCQKHPYLLGLEARYKAQRDF